MFFFFYKLQILSLLLHLNECSLPKIVATNFTASLLLFAYLLCSALLCVTAYVHRLCTSLLLFVCIVSLYGCVCVCLYVCTNAALTLCEYICNLSATQLVRSSYLLLLLLQLLLRLLHLVCFTIHLFLEFSVQIKLLLTAYAVTVVVVVVDIFYCLCCCCCCYYCN